MHKTNAGQTRKAWTIRCLTIATATGLLLAAATPYAGASAQGPRTWIVKPGQSIQAAADKARSGDTIQLKAGTFAEAVCIVGKALTIKGAGRNSTVITKPAVLTDKANCWVAAPVEPQEGVSAIKFVNPDGPVTVENLQTKGHPEDGIVAWGAKKGFTVKHTYGVGHGKYGILAAAGSKDILIQDNVEVGDGTGVGTAGISVSDTRNAKALIKDNRSEGIHIGIFVREARGGTIQGNLVRDNCVGILVFDDSTTEKPDNTKTVIGGDWAVLSNKSIANNRFCLAGRDGTLTVSGVGISVVNADHVLVAKNTIKNNVPQPGEDLLFPPAGLSVLTIPAMPAGTPDPGPAEYVKVKDNKFVGNSPLDVLNGSAGAGIRFSDNQCQASSPTVICAD